MSEQSIQKIIDETVFTMWAEGFVVSDEEKFTLRKVLSGDNPLAIQLERYIQSAKRVGSIAHVQSRI